MATYKSLEELKGNILVRGTPIYFDETKYVVHDHYLSCHNGANDWIFNRLGVDKLRFCTEAYGYEPRNNGGSSGWPELPFIDYEALTRVAIAIYEALEPKTPMEQVAAWVGEVRGET